MKEEKLSWSKGFALICLRCSERKNGVNPECSVQLRDFLKDELKKAGEWGAIRVMSSSCLGLCPQGKLAVSLHPEASPSKIFSVSETQERAKILTKIRAELF